MTSGKINVIEERANRIKNDVVAKSASKNKVTNTNLSRDDVTFIIDEKLSELNRNKNESV